MNLPEIVEFSRNFSVLVKVQGPDPKGLKMRKHAFHQYHSGNTTLSASGMLLPANLYNAVVAKSMFGGNGDQNSALVLTVASVIEPFLSLRNRASISEGRLELIPGARIDVMVEGRVMSQEEAPCWFPAHLLSMVDVPVSSAALQSLIEASSGSIDYGWDIGWSLASYDNGSQPSTDVITQTERESKSLIEGHRHVREEEACNPNGLAKSATRIAILGISLSSKCGSNITISFSSIRGDFLLAVGSPFGILSPAHFFNSVSAGSIANCYPPRSSKRSLLMADVRCLPGMEGSPVFDKHGHLIGILIRPLRQNNRSAEIQLVIPWQAIAVAHSQLFLKEPHVEENGINVGNKMSSAVSNGSWYKTHELIGISSPPGLIVEKVIKSICLITVDDGVWASGVLLNDQGLVLTNAHLLEPWRFGKAGVNGGRNSSGSKAHFFISDELSSAADDIKHYKCDYFWSGHRDVRVRLDHRDSWIWCPAKVVYICKGSLDVALLQLDCVPDKLCPIVANFSCPPLGSKVYVIGHGLFGPRCGFSQSVCSGVVSKVVKAKMVSYIQSTSQEETDFPAMLETTAPVHPGGSGGAVVDSNGHMIGLVTSNARHGGGTVIPHLNFSIPCAVLTPIFEFAKDMQDLKILWNLDQPNGELSSVWALMPPLSPKQNPSLPGLLQSLSEGNSKDGKGSRFAKFIEDRREILGGPSPSQNRSKPEQLPDEMFSSKL